MLTLNEMKDKAFAIAKDHGFHENDGHPFLYTLVMLPSYCKIHVERIKTY